MRKLSHYEKRWREARAPAVVDPSEENSSAIDPLAADPPDDLPVGRPSAIDPTTADQPPAVVDRAPDESVVARAGDPAAMQDVVEDVAEASAEIDDPTSVGPPGETKADRRKRLKRERAGRRESGGGS